MNAFKSNNFSRWKNIPKSNIAQLTVEQRTIILQKADLPGPILACPSNPINLAIIDEGRSNLRWSGAITPLHLNSGWGGGRRIDRHYETRLGCGETTLKGTIAAQAEQQPGVSLIKRWGKGKRIGR